MSPKSSRLIRVPPRCSSSNSASVFTATSYEPSASWGSRSLTQSSVMRTWESAEISFWSMVPRFGGSGSCAVRAFVVDGSDDVVGQDQLGQDLVGVLSESGCFARHRGGSV